MQLCNSPVRISTFQSISIERRKVKIGHFTQIVAMRSKKVGCAAAKFPSKNGDFSQLYLVCNYSFGNMIGEPIYTVGPTASKCTSGRSKIYKGLCRSNENILPLPLGENLVARTKSTPRPKKESFKGKNGSRVF